MRPKSAGLTLIELLLAMAIAALLFGISSILLANLIPRANLTSVTEVLMADLRQQQLKAMIGEKNDSDAADEYGMFIEAGQYTLFQGATYDPAATSNLVTNLPASIQLTTSPSQTIIFTRLNGEIQSFTTTQNITITDTLTTESRTLSLNRYGIPQ